MNKLTELWRSPYPNKDWNEQLLAGQKQEEKIGRAHV